MFGQVNPKKVPGSGRSGTKRSAHSAAAAATRAAAAATTVYNKSVSEPWFSLIKTGLKTVEGRLNKGDFAQMKKGDEIVFSNDSFGYNRYCKVRIVNTKRYRTFHEYLSTEGLNKCLPGVDTINEGENIYHKYYSPEDAQRFGILAITVERAD